MAKTIEVRVVSAFVFEGSVVGPSSDPLTVPEALAKTLLQRGKVTLFEGDGDGSAAGDVALEDMKVADLKAMAVDAGIEGAASMKRADLIAALEAADGS